MTPRECFRFAAKLRTNLDNEGIEVKINDLIERLGL
jgi:hypothetical protein